MSQEALPVRKNARGSITELHAQGLSHRAISEIVKVPSATVGRYIKQMNQNNIDL